LDALVKLVGEEKGCSVTEVGVGNTVEVDVDVDDDGTVLVSA
jgi:hypothetical protein